MEILLILMGLIILIHLIYKNKLTCQTNDDDGIINVEIMVPLKYLSIFGKLLKFL